MAIRSKPLAGGCWYMCVSALVFGIVTVTVAVSVTPALDMAGGTVPCCVVVSPRTVPLHGNNE